MPKRKTNRSAKKRFKITKKGKVIRAKPGRRHLLSSKTGKRRRQMRRVEECSRHDSFVALRLLCKE